MTPLNTSAKLRSRRPSSSTFVTRWPLLIRYVEMRNPLCRQLKEAIALRPQNRIQAKRDEDFQALAADARFRELVFDPEL